MSTLIATTVQSGTIKGADGTNTALTISNDGTILPAKVPCGLLFRNASYGGNATLNSSTKVPYDAEEFDVGSIADVSDSRFEFTTATAGIYFFSASYRINTGNTLQRFIIAIRKNASTYLGQTEYSERSGSGTNAYPQVTTNTIVSVANGDYVDAAYYITAGAGCSQDHGRSAANFFCYRISA